MKTNRLLTALAALSVTLLGACSSTETNTASARAAANEAPRRSYSQDTLKKTGEDTVGRGLTKVDPSVQISGGR